MILRVEMTLHLLKCKLEFFCLNEVSFVQRVYCVEWASLKEFTVNEQMLKAPSLDSSDLHISVLKCNCQTYDDVIGLRLKKPSFVILGA